MIFAVFDVLLAVNMCINYSFFYIYTYKSVLSLGLEGPCNNARVACEEAESGPDKPTIC